MSFLLKNLFIYLIKNFYFEYLKNNLCLNFSGGKLRSTPVAEGVAEGMSGATGLTGAGWGVCAVSW